VAKLKRLGDEYRATTPKGRVFWVEKLWQFEGWLVRPEDGTPLGEEPWDAIHEPRLADVRANLDNGFYDQMYDMNEGEADPGKWKVYEHGGSILTALTD